MPMKGNGRPFWKRVLTLPWKIYGLLVAYIPIVVLFPVVWVCILISYKCFWKIERLWARWVLYAMGLLPRLLNPEARPDFSRQYIIVANHTSMIDIPLMLATVKRPLTFVGKHELAKYPFFGTLYKKTNVLVDRSSLESRKKVYDEVEKFIRDGISIGIFPEGGVIDDSELPLNPFKAGAFRMAIEHKLPILPMVFLDNKKRLPYTLTEGKPGALRVKFLPVVETKHLDIKEWQDLRDYVYSIMYNEILQDQLKKKGIETE